MSEGIEQVKIRVLPDGRVSGRDAAAFLGCQEKTLAMWRWQNIGPRPIKVGGRVFYRIDDLRRFAGGDSRGEAA